MYHLHLPSGRLTRRQWLASTSGSAAVAALLGSSLSAPVKAQEAFPNKPIHLVIGFPPGGTSDIVANIVKESLVGLTGQPLVLDHRPGAGGVVATSAIARAPADGYVIGYTSNAFLTVTPHLVDVPYNALTDIEPVALFGGSVNLLAVNPALPVTNVTEFLAYARAKSGKLFFGSSGVATGSHIGTEYFKKKAGFDATHVPYKGSAAAIADLLGGRLDFLVDPALAPYIVNGQARGLGVFDAERHPNPALSQLPAVGQFIKDWNPPRWINFLTVPRGTPVAVKERLAQLLNQVLSQPDVIHRLGESSYLAATRESSKDLPQRVEGEYKAMGLLLREAGITPNDAPKSNA